MPISADEIRRPGSNDTQTVVNVSRGIDLISDGLLMIDQSEGELLELGGPKAVDITARLNAQYSALERLVRPLKENIRIEAYRDGSETVRGDVYQAGVRKIIKRILDKDKIKSFLGTSFPQFLKNNEEVEVSFHTKV